jgi:hypothetical protein
MKLFIRNALLGAAGLVVLSLSAHAAGSTAVTETPVMKSNATQQQLAQRPYDPSAGSVGFKKSKKTTQQMAQRPYDPSAGSVGFKKSKKKKAKK